jgi:hypothetical protein
VRWIIRSRAEIAVPAAGESGEWQFSMAKNQLEQMQVRQDSLRQGLTPELQQLIQAVQAGGVDYPERSYIVAIAAGVSGEWQFLYGQK